jgi:bacterioferritin-associated ferredoxin
MYVCVCQAITDKQLNKLAAKADGDFKKLQLKHGVAATCGRCEGCAKEICSKYKSASKSVCA